MDLRQYEIILGQRHPWEVARAAILKKILLGGITLSSRPRVLDVGCGDGFTNSIVLPVGHHVHSVRLV